MNEFLLCWTDRIPCIRFPAILVLQKELAELWAASKAGESQNKDPSERLQQGDPHVHEALKELDSAARKSSDKRKFSTDRKPSSDLSSSDKQKGGKGSDAAGGSQDSAAALWSTQAVPQLEQDHTSVCGSDSAPCLRWLPYKVSLQQGLCRVVDSREVNGAVLSWIVWRRVPPQNLEQDHSSVCGS